MCVLTSKDSEVHKYKYHVESPATDKDLIKSLEFISGPQTGGGVIDRSLKLYINKIPTIGKFMNMKTVQSSNVAAELDNVVVTSYQYSLHLQHVIVDIAHTATFLVSNAVLVTHLCYTSVLRHSEGQYSYDTCLITLSYHYLTIDFPEQ